MERDFDIIYLEVAMKRYIILYIFACVLLCGCNASGEKSSPSVISSISSLWMSYSVSPSLDSDIWVTGSTSDGTNLSIYATQPTNTIKSFTFDISLMRRARVCFLPMGEGSTDCVVNYYINGQELWHCHN